MAREILLIEPDELLGLVYGAALRANGFVVTRTFSAKKAIEMVDQRCPDLIITELQLVSHSGIEFLYELRTYDDWLEVPVIVLSLVPPVEFIPSKHCLNGLLGVNQYLYKPNTNLVQLIRAVNELVVN